MSGMQRWGAWEKTVVCHSKWWVVTHPLGVSMCTHPVAPGSNNTHVLLTQPHPCGPMSEQCGTRLCRAPGLHHWQHSGLGKMLTAGAVCPCDPHLRHPCDPQLTVNIPSFFDTNTTNYRCKHAPTSIITTPHGNQRSYGVKAGFSPLQNFLCTSKPMSSKTITHVFMHAT